MLNRFLHLIFAAMVSSMISSGAFAMGEELQGTLIVVNREGGSVSFIDFPSKVEVARIPIGPVIPHEVDVSPDGRYAITGEYGGSTHGEHLVLMDIENASIVSRISLGPNSRPHTVMFMPDGRHALATMQESDLIGLIDLSAEKLIRTYPTGGREGHMLRISPDGSRAYVASRGAEGTLSVIFLDQDRDPLVIETGPGAEGLDVSPDGSEVWVANRLTDTISVIDTDSLSVIETLPSRRLAGRVAFNDDGSRVVVPNGGFGEDLPQYLRVFNANTREILDEVPLRDGTPQQGNFGVLVMGDYVFTGDATEGVLKMFKLGDLSQSEVLLQNHELPDGLAWSPVRVGVMN